MVAVKLDQLLGFHVTKQCQMIIFVRRYTNLVSSHLCEPRLFQNSCHVFKQTAQFFLNHHNKHFTNCNILVDWMHSLKSLHNSPPLQSFQRKQMRLRYLWIQKLSFILLTQLRTCLLYTSLLHKVRGSFLECKMH